MKPLKSGNKNHVIIVTKEKNKIAVSWGKNPLDSSENILLLFNCGNFTYGWKTILCKGKRRSTFHDRSEFKEKTAKISKK